MSKYRALTPVKTADGKIHKPNEVFELTDQEAKNCMSFNAVTPVPESSQPSQQTVIPSAVQAQPEPEASQETDPLEDTIVPPESDVR